MKRTIQIGGIAAGHKLPLIVIAGPCVIEGYDKTYEIALRLKEITDKLKVPFIFKASYDKANRTSLNSFRGPGLKKGLNILNRIKDSLKVTVISDVHNLDEIEHAAEVIDIIQIPAFLCRQTDLIIKASQTGKPLNIKKGQFIGPGDVKNITDKARSTGNQNISVTERGCMFGYNNLVVDYRGIKIIHETTGCPVIFDATHSVQLPGGSGTSSGGQRDFAPLLAKAAVAAGADGIFIETHTEPDKALCDGPNSMEIEKIEELLATLQKIREIVQ